MSIWWDLLIVVAAFMLLGAYVWHVVGGDPEGATRVFKGWTAELQALRAKVHGGEKCPRGRKGCDECATARAELQKRKKEIRAELPKPLVVIGRTVWAIRWFITGR